MRGKTQVGQMQDRNANGRVDPFHMPTELADGLEAESLPRVRRPRLAPAELASRVGGRLDDAGDVTFNCNDHHAARGGFSAPPGCPGEA